MGLVRSATGAVTGAVAGAALVLPVTALRSVAGTAARTARAAARVDPGALVGSLADLPTALAALSALPAVVASVTSLVGAVEQAVVDVVPRIEGLLGDIEAIPPRAGAVLDGVEAIPPRVAGLLGQVEGVVAGVDPVLAGATRAVEGAERAVGGAERAVGGAERVIGGGRRVVTRADALVGALDGPVDALVPVLTLLGGLEVDLLTRLGAVVAGLEPLLAQAARVDPRQAAEVAGALPDLLDTVDDEVLPALRALHGIVPAVEALNHDVERLRQVVGDLGSIVGGLPGAGRLLRRGGERAESTARSPAELPH